MQKYNNCSDLIMFFLHLSIQFIPYAPMKNYIATILAKQALLLLCAFFAIAANAQDDTEFWDKVRIGGNLGVAFGSGYTDVTLAPGALYEFNQYLALGAGVQGTYVHQRNYYDAYMYGGSAIAIFNPVPTIQLSAEVEQLRVNTQFDREYYEEFVSGTGIARQRDFWNTALFFGVGYRMDNVTVGLRFNVLYNEDDLVYSDAFMPFLRVYF